MRTGGIFGDGALGVIGGGVFGRKQASGLGIAVDTGSENWDMGAAASKAACYAAQKLGENDRISGKAMVTTTAYSRIGYVWASNEDKTKLSECYATGYLSAAQSAKSSEPAKTPIPEPTTTQTAYSSTGPSPYTGSGLACSDPSVIRSVQGQIGVTADGKWGPNSQATLTKLGKTFKAFAPNCTGAVPYYGGTSSGGGTTIVSTTGGQAPAPMVGASTLSMSRLSSSPVFWAVMLAAGVGGYLYLTSGKKGKR